jgi:hypothetical protein
MSTATKSMRDRAEARFEKNQAVALERQKATAEYESEAAALRKRTARLRALRLAKEETDRQAALDAAASAPAEKSRPAKRTRKKAPASA